MDDEAVKEFEKWATHSPSPGMDYSLEGRGWHVGGNMWNRCKLS